MHSETFSGYVGQLRRKVQKAIKEKGKKAAGGKQYNWIMNPRNWDAPEARQFKDGKWHFFFNAASLGRVPYVGWNVTDHKFVGGGSWLARDWTSNNRAVLLD